MQEEEEEWQVGRVVLHLVIQVRKRLRKTKGTKKRKSRKIYFST